MCDCSENDICFCDALAEIIPSTVLSVVRMGDGMEYVGCEGSWANGDPQYVYAPFCRGEFKRIPNPAILPEFNWEDFVF